MALPWLQRVELVLFAAAFLCGAVAAATLTRTQGSFGGSCPLYGVAALNGSSLALLCPSAPSLCYFVAGASGILALYCLLLLFFWVYSSCIEDSHRGSIGLRIALAISVTAVFLILVSACILRFGTNSFCNSIISLNQTTSCSEAQKISWTPPGTAVQFYSNLHNAEVRQRDMLRLSNYSFRVFTMEYMLGCTAVTYGACHLSLIKIVWVGLDWRWLPSSYSCSLSQTSSWVNLILWCLALMLQVMQCKFKATSSQPQERGDQEWSSETDALVGQH